MVPPRRSALTALAVASALLTIQSSGAADNFADSKTSVAQQIVDDAQGSPAIRAYFLLSLAESYLEVDGVNNAEQLFVGTPDHPMKSWRLFMFHFNESLTSWSKALSTGRPRYSRQYTVAAKSDSLNEREESVALAEIALAKAMKQVELTDYWYKLNFYYISSILYAKAGNETEAKIYRIKVAEAIKSCDSSTGASAKKIEAVVSILDDMAYGILPIDISEKQSIQEVNRKNHGSISLSDESFKKCEQIRLQAITIADRLDSTNDVRRRSHRDMAIWYYELGKPELASAQKHILFQLVGIEDDRLLYPVQGVCGQYHWWHIGPIKTNVIGCGMG